jgi:hypothetical protein
MRTQAESRERTVEVLHSKLEIALIPPRDDAACGFEQRRQSIVHSLSVRAECIFDVFHLLPPGDKVHAIGVAAVF